jgi:hypothetical protein
VFLLAIFFNMLEADWLEMRIQDNWSVGLDTQCIGLSWLDGNFLTKNLDDFQEIII